MYESVNKAMQWLGTSVKIGTLHHQWLIGRHVISTTVRERVVLNM